MNDKARDLEAYGEFGRPHPKQRPRPRRGFKARQILLMLFLAFSVITLAIFVRNIHYNPDSATDNANLPSQNPKHHVFKALMKLPDPAVPFHRALSSAVLHGQNNTEPKLLDQARPFNCRPQGRRQLDHVMTEEASCELLSWTRGRFSDSNLHRWTYAPMNESEVLERLRRISRTSKLQ